MKPAVYAPVSESRMARSKIRRRTRRRNPYTATRSNTMARPNSSNRISGVTMFITPYLCPRYRMDSHDPRGLSVTRSSVPEISRARFARCRYTANVRVISPNTRYAGGSLRHHIVTGTEILPRQRPDDQQPGGQRSQQIPKDQHDDRHHRWAPLRSLGRQTSLIGVPWKSNASRSLPSRYLR